MDSQNLRVLPIHKHPEYKLACIDLVNAEWPNSESVIMLPTRMAASCDELPTSFVLVDDTKNLLGHIQLTPISGMPESCYIETLVINKQMRGKQLGSFLMKYVEDYCRSTFKMKRLYLTTKCQGYFYAKLGYEVCEPISLKGEEVPSSKPESDEDKALKLATFMKSLPPQLMIKNCNISFEEVLKIPKTFMMKNI